MIMMKRLSLMLALLLCLLSFSIAAAEQSRDIVLDMAVLKQYENITSLCWVDETLYMLGTGGVYQWSEGSAQPTRMLDLSAASQYAYRETPPDGNEELQSWQKAIRFLFSDGTKLYGLHPSSGQIYYISSDVMKPVAQIPPDLLSVQSGDTPFFREIKSIAGNSENLCLLLGTNDYNDYEKTELITFSIDDHSLIKSTLQAVQSIASGAKGKLLLYTSGEDGGIWQYEPITDTCEQKLSTLHAGESLNGLAWFGEKNAPVYYAANRVCLVESSDIIAIKAYLPISFTTANTGAVCSASGLYAYPYGQYVFIRDISQAEPAAQTVLKIIGDFSPQTMIGFTIENPDIAIVNASTSIGDFLQQATITVDESMDLFVVAAPGDYADIRNKGFAEPLNGDDELVRMAKELYPTIHPRRFFGTSGTG